MARKAKNRKRRGRSSGEAPAVGAAMHSGGGPSSDAAPDSPPRPEICRIIDKMGHEGIILLLFETPSGYAIFRFDGAQLYLTNALDNIWAFFVKDFRARDVIWLKEFKPFKNKANAINHTGVNPELAEMIHKWHKPGQLLAVGKPEHKTIIESTLEIPCLHNETVMEVIWGIKNLMKSLVPLEDFKLSKKDKRQMSSGMDKILRRYGIAVTPEMVDKDIIENAYTLYECEICATRHSEFLATCGEHLKEISYIDCKGWSPMKLATALMILSLPEEDIPSDLGLDYSEEEVFKLKNDGFKYESVLLMTTCVRIYSEMMSTRRILAATVEKLKSLTILRRYGIAVTLEMVDKDIIVNACTLYDCETRHSEFLAICGEHLKEISCVDCKGWSPMKLATAFMILSYPEEDIPSDPELDYSEEEVLKLKNDGFKYEGALMTTCVRIYSEMVSAHKILVATVEKLKSLPTKTNKTKPESCGAPMKEETV